MTAVHLHPPALVSALGSGIAAHTAALLDPPAAPLTYSDTWIPGKRRAFGAIHRALRPFPPHLAAIHHSRNNQLLWDALAQIEPQIHAAIARYSAPRIGIVIGTSTSGVDENIPMFQHVARGGAWRDIPFRQQQQIHSAPADAIAALYGLQGPCYGVSTACTSGARALISAARLLKSGQCDAVICGGVDTLSPLTINGFSALEVLSPAIANPFSRHRDGINIGEAAALFLMTREPGSDTLPLLGYGASSDAWHMSSPRPDGQGAINAFTAALNHARLAPGNIGWINLHGTGTPHNDHMESHAIARLFGNNTPATSTKPLTGHTLGAAGALEAAFLWLITSRHHNPQGRLPAHRWDNQPDPELPAIALTHSQSHWPHPRRIAASASFAFGGNNSVLIIGEPQP
ncbi:MAG: beta-ketoacyl-ACP synthase [Cardiobacteriaceae bacterium]|nr:beta-ketoacyl-ACP synthase [Cardiobacteriaceae bacterium]